MRSYIVVVSNGFLLPILFLSIPSFSYSQDTGNCGCKDAFDNIVIKIRENYIAYRLTENEIDAPYQKHVKKFRKKVSTTNDENCSRVLQEFLRFFRDGHLFVSEIPDFDPKDLEIYKSMVREKRVDVSAVKKYLVSHRNTLSEIEGLWTDGTSKFALVKDTNPKSKFQYVAVIVDTEVKDKIGEIKFGVNFDQGRYEGTYYTNGYAPRYVAVTPTKQNSMLSIWGGIFWGRVNFIDLPSIESASVFNPILPTFKKIDDASALLTIPSFLVEKNLLDKVLIDNLESISDSKYLVIDIRGNNGGNGIYFDLLSLYATKPIVSEVGLALSSEDNLAYFQRFAKDEKNDPYAPVVEEMKLKMGQVVKGPRFASFELEHMDTKIEKVIILTDSDNISAAETFILYSKSSSDKVLTIGRNTGGVVDYNNINMIKLKCKGRGIHFGYPTYTLHNRIPKDGYNRTGIKPDITADTESKDFLKFVMNKLEH